MVQALHRVFKSLVLSIAIVVFFAVSALQPPAMAQSSSLLQRLQDLRSTSPESGVYAVQSSTFNVAVTDALVENLQQMSEDSAMAMRASDPELREMATKWHDETEETLAKVQDKRNAFFLEQLEALRSTSPESGAN